ncbi:MAG: hypothetical protein IKW79_07360, partial [Schwartzia sp.]|nr:hypothetical protein [Schwartzia sp. (in: firmicutes)]
MKVLIEVDESKLQEVAGALKKPEIGAKILGTGKNMTLDTVFAAEDVWTLIVDPCHEASFASDHFDDVQLLNIESYGRNEYLETVINWLNHHFDANEGLNWQLVFSAAKHIYNALNLEKEAYAVIDHVSVDGLRTALRRYDDNGERGECGSWEIHSS